MHHFGKRGFHFKIFVLILQSVWHLKQTNSIRSWPLCSVDLFNISHRIVHLNFIVSLTTHFKILSNLYKLINFQSTFIFVVQSIIMRYRYKFIYFTVSLKCYQMIGSFSNWKLLLWYLNIIWTKHIQKRNLNSFLNISG